MERLAFRSFQRLGTKDASLTHCEVPLCRLSAELLFGAALFLESEDDAAEAMEVF